jgi:hypothetical protein
MERRGGARIEMTRRRPVLFQVFAMAKADPLVSTEICRRISYLVMLL